MDRARALGRARRLTVRGRSVQAAGLSSDGSTVLIDEGALRTAPPLNGRIATSPVHRRALDRARRARRAGQLERLSRSRSPRSGCSIARVPDSIGGPPPQPCHRTRRPTMAKIKVKNPRRRPRRRRDDADHLVVHQGAADPALPRRRAEVLRPRHREPRRDRRSDHRRSRRSDQALRRRREVRDDHARRGAREGVRPEGDVSLAERHDPQHPRRRDLPRADRDRQRSAARARLDQADRDRPPRLRRPVPRHRHGRSGRGHADADVHADGRQRADRARRLRLPRRRHRDGDVQPRRLDPRLRARLAALRPGPQLPGLPVDEEHDPQTL